jgi:FkbM family methyltransferase
MISYAQNREDVLLNRVFRDQSQGFYVDVGANDPTVFSVTRYFYDRGWHGINVEPGQIFERLRQERPRDVNLNVAVSDVSGPVTFYEFPDYPGSSTVDAGLLDRIEEFTSRRLTRSVQAVTLREILAQYAPATIDFLSVDVETHERQVLAGNDWERFRPRVVLVEATLPYSTVHNHASWEDILLAAGYLFAFFDGLNRFYVRREDADLLPILSVPVNVLDDFELAESHRFRAEADQLRAHLEQAQAQVRLHEEDRRHLLGEAERLHRDVTYIDGVARAREAECQRLLGEAEELHRNIKNLDGVAQLRGAEIERLRHEIRHLDAAVAQGQDECLGLRQKSQRDEGQLERLQLELEYYAGMARLSDRDRVRLEAEAGRLQAVTQERAAVMAGLTAEAERYRLELENARAVAGRWQQDCNALRGEVQRLGQTHAALTHGTGARSLWLGLQVARGLHWAVRQGRRLTGSRGPGGGPRPAEAVPPPVPPGPEAAPAAPAGTPHASNEGGPSMTPLKHRIKACLGVPFKLAKVLLRPIAARVRGYLLAPLAPHLEAVPRLCALLDQHGAVLSQLQGQHGAAQEQLRHLTQQVAHLQEQQHAVQRGLGHVEQTLATVQGQQTQVLQQMHGEKGVLRETEQMMLAMLKAAQFTRPERDGWEETPRIYRNCEGS